MTPNGTTMPIYINIYICIYTHCWLLTKRYGVCWWAQVLVSAVAASTLGQLVKPFAAALSGKGFNWKLIIKSGGLPSSHSAVSTSSLEFILMCSHIYVFEESESTFWLSFQGDFGQNRSFKIQVFPSPAGLSVDIFRFSFVHLRYIL